MLLSPQQYEDFNSIDIADWDRWMFGQSMAGSVSNSVDFSLTTLGRHLSDADDYFYLGEFEKAADSYLQLWDPFHENGDFLLRLMHCLDHSCNWEKREKIGKIVLEMLERSGCIGTIEPLCYLSEPLDQKQSCLFSRNRASQFSYEDDRKLNYSETKSNKQKIKLGYLSLDFKSHHCGVDLHPIIANHDSAKFDVTIFSILPMYVNKNLDRFGTKRKENVIDLSRASWRSAIDKIRNCELDILVDTTRNIRSFPSILLSQRLAKIHVSNWGYGGTSGIQKMDFIFSDTVILPDDNNAEYTETPVLLPAYLPVQELEIFNDSVENIRHEFGIPIDQINIACFCNHYKINEVIFCLWMALLKRVPESVLYLSHGHEYSRNRLKLAAKNMGVDSSRIKFMPNIKKASHVRRLKAMDLVVDNPRLGASSSVIDALQAGVPCLTWYGSVPEERGAASILQSLGLDSYVCSSKNDFLETAVRIMSDLDLIQFSGQLEKILNTKNRASHPQKYVKNLEKAYSRIVEDFPGFSGNPFTD